MTASRFRVSKKHARARQYHHDVMRKWRVGTIVVVLPIMLQLASHSLPRWPFGPSLDASQHCSRCRIGDSGRSVRVLPRHHYSTGLQGRLRISFSCVPCHLYYPQTLAQRGHAYAKTSLSSCRRLVQCGGVRRKQYEPSAYLCVSGLGREYAYLARSRSEFHPFSTRSSRQENHDYGVYYHIRYKVPHVHANDLPRSSLRTGRAVFRRPARL